MTDHKAPTLGDLIANVRLQDVRLMESSAATRVRTLEGLADPTVSIANGTKILHRFNEGFIIGARLTVRVEKSEESNPAADALIQISVTFAMTYLVPEATTYADDVVVEFAGVNGVFNAWPYWREYVQSTSSRMNLPPMVLPVFRVSTGATKSTTSVPSPKSPLVEGAKQRTVKRARRRR